MSTLRLSPLFFKKEAKSYSSPAMGFWREYIQNSVDANAKNIFITVESGGEGKAIVTIEDDGCGMTMDVMNNVFFNLGESNKGGDSVGGFGRARILTCFAQDFYKIATSNVYAEGWGSEYNICERDLNIKGCEFQVGADLEVLRCTDSEGLKRRLIEFLSLCNLKCNVYVNKQKFDTSKYLRANRTIEESSWYKMGVNKQKNNNYVFVRVNGVFMFQQWISAPKAVILEIEPKKSREILTSNRDGFVSEYVTKLNQLCEEINSNSQKTKGESILQYIHGKTPHRFFPQAKSKPAPAMMASNSADVSLSPAVSDIVADYIKNYNIDIDIKPSNSLSVTDSIVDNMMYYVETASSDVRKWAKLWHPTLLHKSNGKGNTRRKLLGQWEIACRYAVEAFAEKTNYNITSNYDLDSWSVGLCFSTDLGALYSSHNRIATFLLNPIDSNGKIKYSLRSYESHVALVVLACHEVAHITGSHTEFWGNMFTYIQCQVMPKMAEIHKRMIEVE